MLPALPAQWPPEPGQITDRQMCLWLRSAATAQCDSGGPTDHGKDDFLPLDQVRILPGMREADGWALERMLAGLPDIAAESVAGELQGFRCTLRLKSTGEWLTNS